MKKYIKYAVLITGMFFLTGCSENSSKMPVGNSVEKAINEQISAADAENAAAEGTAAEGTLELEKEIGKEETAGEDTASGENAVGNAGGNANSEAAADYDLTKMDSDMVYATVYQLMTDPQSYIGKTIRINGNYSAAWYEPTATNYHYVLIKDALACCAQGMEFVWEDGNHIYPDEYPDEGTAIAVTGVFETYREEGDPNLYCRLKNASLTVLN